MEVWLILRQPYQAAVCIAHDCRQWLRDFVRDRRRQGSDARHAGCACELRSCLAEGLLCESVLRHILNRANAFESAIQISDHTSDCAQILAGAGWHAEADLVLIAAAMSRQLQLLLQQRDVFWVDSGRDPFER